jgi:hypothetical protein
MYVQVKNENYGYSVATHDDWVVVGNPSSFRFNPASPTNWRTGSIDIFKYNTLTDQHDLLLTVYKPVGSADEVLLAEDPTAEFIHTDIYKTGWISSFGLHGRNWIQYTLQDLPIQIDATDYVSKYEDDYGHSIDVYNNILAVGSRWHNQLIDISGKLFYITGSSVDIYDLTQLKSSFYDGYISTGSAFLASVINPPVGELVSGSFGASVSINDEWLAVGSPEWESTKGGVHMYRRNRIGDENDINYTFFTTITGSTNITGDFFGYSIDINKQTSSYSSSLVVGCGNKVFAGSKVYYFEFNGTDWQEKHKFEADRSIYNLPFYDINPVTSSTFSDPDGFGNSVSLFNDTIAIGAPIDRTIYEYSGSRQYKQGAVYLFNKCSSTSDKWSLVQKFYGNVDTIKNNKMGFSVDLWNDKLVIGCPKENAESMSSCYIQGSTFQKNYCYANLENYINGQWILLQQNTSSILSPWEVLNVYQKKKRYLSPYKSLGYDVCIGNKSIVVGAPMIVADDSRSFDIQYTGSQNGTTYIPLDDLSGKAYIYNLDDLRENFHVGNVFYRNGKIVLNTSGSVFEDLWFNPVNEYNYEYEVHFDSKQTLYEKQIACVIEPGEFNVSTNPTSTIREKADFDINANGWFDWQDMDVILRYMQGLNTRYSSNPTTDWSSSLLTTDDEISCYNYYSTLNAYTNTGADYVTQSFFNILDNLGIQEFDFNQDSKVDLNDLKIFWKYCSNRLNQTNYKSYITPNSKRKLFSDIIDYLSVKTRKNTVLSIKPEFLTADELSKNDITGSYIKPYITTVGLYNGLDLVAVAKLGSPIKNCGDFPLNIVVKIDF